MTRGPALCFWAGLVVGCGKRLDPPGATREPSARALAVSAIGAVESTAVPAGSTEGPSKSAPASGPTPGSSDDNLPFAPDGTRIASVAWRTWIYTNVGKLRTRYGYLRVGAQVD